MSLPAIDSLVPVVSGTPTSYPQVYATRVRIDAAPGQPWRLNARFVPYSYADDMLMPGASPVQLNVDVMSVAEQYPATVGQAMAGFVQVLALMYKKQEISEALANLEVPEEGENPMKAPLEAALAQVEDMLVGEEVVNHEAPDDGS